MNVENINKLKVDFDEKGKNFSHIIPSIHTCRNSRHSCQWECQNSLYHTHRTAAIYANPTWYQSHAASLHWNEKRQMIRQSQSCFSQHIECFHSRDQHLCKFIGTKESVCIRKEFHSHRIGSGHQHGRRFIVLGHQYGRRDVMWKHSIANSSGQQLVLVPVKHW